MSTTPKQHRTERLAKLRASFSAHADADAMTLLGQLTRRHSSSLDIVRHWFDARETPQPSRG